MFIWQPFREHDIWLYFSCAPLFYERSLVRYQTSVKCSWTETSRHREMLCNCVFIKSARPPLHVSVHCFLVSQSLAGRLGHALLLKPSVVMLHLIANRFWSVFSVRCLRTISWLGLTHFLLQYVFHQVKKPVCFTQDSRVLPAVHWTDFLEVIKGQEPLWNSMC